MKMGNVCDVSIGSAGLQLRGAVQCLHTENTQIRPVVANAHLKPGPTYVPSFSSADSLSCTVLTRGDVRWIVRVRADPLVLVTTMAAVSGHWLTVYVSTELSYLHKGGTKHQEGKEGLLMSKCKNNLENDISMPFYL